MKLRENKRGFIVMGLLRKSNNGMETGLILSEIIKSKNIQHSIIIKETNLTKKELREILSGSENPKLSRLLELISYLKAELVLKEGGKCLAS